MTSIERTELACSRRQQQIVFRDTAHHTPRYSAERVQVQLSQEYVQQHLPIRECDKLTLRSVYSSNL